MLLTSYNVFDFVPPTCPGNVQVCWLKVVDNNGNGVIGQDIPP
jgi:hypothetical protein